MEVQQRRCINASYDTENLGTGEENISKDKETVRSLQSKGNIIKRTGKRDKQNKQRNELCECDTQGNNEANHDVRK